MTGPFPESTNAGFTLVEALVATAVLAVISLLMAPALVGAMNAAGRSQGLTEQLEERAALQAVVHELFASTHQATDGDAAFALQGSANSVSFLVRPKNAQLQHARLELGEQRLALTLTPIDDDANDQTLRRQEIVLAEGFEAARFSYIGIQRDTWRRVDRTVWEDEQPPRLVALDLDWSDGSRTRIQALVAGEGRYDCRFDSGRGLCLGDTY